MANTKIVSLAVVAILVIAGIAAVVMMNDRDDDSNNATKDFAGQEIVPVKNLDNGIVAVGQDSMRWVTYFGLADKCVMVDMNDMSNYLGKSFMYIGRAVVNIEGGDSATLTGSDAARMYFTHTNCGITDEDVKTILKLKPSIMVVPNEFYNDYALQMKTLESEGINTVAISNIYTFLEKDTLKPTDNLIKQIDILSKALDQPQKGKDLKNAFNYLLDDLAKLRSKIKADEVKTAYVGALAYNGAHGLDSSISYYMPMELAGVKNIMSGTVNYEGSGVKTYSASDIASKMDKDTILLVDASGYFKNDTNESKGIAKLFQGHDAFIVADYIWTGMNFDTIFVDAYQILRYAYGDDVLTESELDEKISQVYKLFYGTDKSNRNISTFKSYTVDLPGKDTTIFEDMNAFHLVARHNPIFGTVSIDSDGNLSYA